MFKKLSHLFRLRSITNLPIPYSIRIFSFILSVTITTAGVGYYLAFAANTTIGNNISTSGSLTVGSNSLFTGAINASSTLQVTGTPTFYTALTVQGTGTSTFANGIQLSGGCFRDASGSCITSGGGGGSGTVISGTTGQISFYDSTGTAVSGTSTIFISTARNVGIGTTTPNEALTVKGNIAVLATSGINPVLKGSAATDDEPDSVYVSGRYAYVVNSSSGTLQIFDVSTSSPSLVGSVGTVGGIYQTIHVSGRYAYVTLGSGSDALRIYDVSNPSAPVLVGSVSISSAPQFVFVSGRYAYVVATGSNTLQVVDISNPASPFIAGSVDTGSIPQEIYVSGRYAYVTNADSNTFQIFDISNPVSPSLVGSVSTGSSPQAIYVSGRYAYVTANGPDTIQIFDISNPVSPSPIGSVSVGGNPDSIYVSGRYVYVTNSDLATLQVYDVLNPASPFLVGSVAAGSNPFDVYVSGRYAYVVDASGDTLQIFDVGGLETTSAIVHSLEAGNLQVRNDIHTQGQLKVGGGINVGTGGIFSAGPLSVGIASSTQSDAISGFFQGRVGIGTTSPSQRLSIHGNALFSGDLTLANLTATGTIIIQGTGTSTFANGIQLSSGCFRLPDGSCAGAGGAGPYSAGVGILSIIGSGSGNTAGGDYSVVSGGLANSAVGNYSFVGGGGSNVATGTNATIAGGLNNQITNVNVNYAFIGGGSNNTISAPGGSGLIIVGGQSNSITANGNGNIIVGGNSNVLSGNVSSSFIGSGGSNEVSGVVGGAIVGGSLGAASNGGFIGSGSGNTASGLHSVVVNGQNNTASGGRSFIGSGFGTTASGDFSVANGNLNSATQQYSAALSGSANAATGLRCLIAGGSDNGCSGFASAVVAGNQNFATGDYATVPGGLLNLAQGNYSFAAGRQAKAIHDGVFVWADSTNADFTSMAADQFLIRAAGGVGIGTTSPSSRLSVQGGVLVSGTLSVANLIATGTTQLNGVVYTWPSADGNSGETLSTDGAGNLSWAAGGGGGSLFTDGGLTTRLTSSDNLGIGTTSTAFKLGIQGNALFSGNLTAADITATGTLTLAGNLLPTTAPASTSAGVISTLVNSSTAIQYSALAIGGDGNPVIAYYDQTNGDLLVTKCANATCSLISATTTVDSLGDVGQYASIATTTDGFPIIAYYDATNTNLKVVKCGNAACSSGNTITTVDADGSVGQYTSIAVPADNLPVISYFFASNGIINSDLRMVKCGNDSCSSGNTIITVDPTSSGQTTTLVIGTDGFPVIGGFNGAGNVLRVTKCGNAACTSTTTTQFTDAFNGTADVQIGSDGNPIFAFQYQPSGNMAVFKCSNASCTAGALTELTGFVTANPSLVIGTDGFPIVIGDTGGYAKCADLNCASFTLHNFNDTITFTSALLASDGFVNISYSDGGSNLRFVDCPNASCSSGVTIAETAYVSTDLGQYSSMVLDSSENPMIAYYDATNGNLGYVHCGNSDCTSGNASTTVDTGNVGAYSSNSIATSTDGFAVIAYYDLANQDLKVAKCNDLNCTAPTITTVDSSANDVGAFNSITIDPATGFPIISYQDASTGFIWVAQCGNEACSSGNTLTLVESFDDFTSSNSHTTIAIAGDGKPMLLYRSSSTGNIFLTKCDDMACAIGGNSSTTVYDQNGSAMKLARASDGNPVFVYRDDSNGGTLVLVKCGSTTCNTGNSTTTVDAVSILYPSLKIGANGFPSVSYQDTASANLKFVQCTNATCTANNKNTVDHAGAVGIWSSLAIRSSDGLPVISHYTSSNTDIKLNACDDVACANEDTIVERLLHPNIGANFDYPSIAKGSDDLPIISYYDTSNQDLKVTHCGNTSCSILLTTTVDPTDQVGEWSAIAIGGDNLPVIAYKDSTNAALKVAHCSSNDCSSSALTTIESGLASSPEYISITIGNDGFPVIAYRVSGVGLKVAKCGNATCSSGNTVTLADSGGEMGYYASIEIGADGYPVIAHVTTPNQFILRVVKCANESCSSIASAVSLSSPYVDYIDLAIGENGLPVIVYFDADYNGNVAKINLLECSNNGCTGNDNRVVEIYSLQPYQANPQAISIVKGADGLLTVLFLERSGGLDAAPTVIKCGSPDCTLNNKISMLDKLVPQVERTALALGSDGNPILSYIGTGSNIKYVHCGDDSCTSFGGANFTGGSDIGTSQLFFHNAYIESIFANSIKIKRFDLAEDYYSRDNLEPGELVSLDKDEPLHIHKADSNDGNLILGIISTEPALTLTDYLTPPSNDKNYPVALSGRVPTKVNTEGGGIAIGDPLTISNQSGIAKKASLNGREKIIGYALEKYTGPTTKNSGKILVFVSSQFRQGTDVMTVIQQNGDQTSLLANVVDSVKGWLSSMQITIEDGIMTVKNLVAEKITTKKLCVDDVCIDKSQLQSILNAAGNPQPTVQTVAVIESPVVESATTDTPSDATDSNEETTTESPAEVSSAGPSENPIPTE